MTELLYKKQMTEVYEPIDRDEQYELCNRIREGDMEARDQVVHSCLPMVFQIAYKFHLNNRHISLEDFISEGNLALVKAVDGWDADVSSITTVATRYVTNALIDTAKDSKYSIRCKYSTSRQAVEDIIKIKNCKATKLADIAEETGFKISKVKKLQGIINAKRIDFSLFNFALHDKDNRDDSPEHKSKSCIADLENLVQNKIEDETDRRIFMAWIKYIRKNNKTRLVANEVGQSVDYVSASLKRTKKVLKANANA